VTTIVNIHDAKTHLSRLVERARQGERITIARAGVPVAMLVAIEPETDRSVRSAWTAARS
jgi:prevent-host-death family protein